MARVLIPVDREASLTFRDFARDCCAQLHQWGYSAETIATYDRAYMQFLTFLKSRGVHDDVRSFSDDHVLAFAEELGRRGINPNTIIKALSALSSLARYGGMRKDARGARLVAQDPTKSFRWPTAQRQETQYLQPLDLRRLLDVEAEPHKAHARDLLVETGMRVGEAARLNVGDLREAGGRYYVGVRVKGRGQQRRQETRQVPLSKALGDALHGWVLARGAVHPDEPLLINSEGKRWSPAVLSNMVARLAAKAGITALRVSGHKVRHTANVIARLAQVDAPTRGKLLGHSSLRSLERYEHVMPHELHQAREQQLAALQDYIGEPFHVDPESTALKRKSEVPNVKDDAEMRDRG